MTKDWLIAHRGARCDGHENTLVAFEATKRYPLGWVELDVHTTKDGVVICHHDFYVNGLDIELYTFKELKTADPQLATFDETINTIEKAPLIVEIKPTRTAKNIIMQLRSNPDWQVASFKSEVIKELIALKVDRRRLFLLQHDNSFRLLKTAIDLGIGGIGINQRVVTPSLYLRARKHGLKMYTYTVNSPWQAKLFRLLYPKLLICTDRPDLLKDIR